MTITIDSAAEFLNDHSRMFSTEIQTKTRVGLEMENLLPQRMSTGEYYVVLFTVAFIVNAVRQIIGK